MDNTLVVPLQTPSADLNKMATYPGFYTVLAQEAGITSFCADDSNEANNNSRVLVALIDNLPPNPPESGGTKKIGWGKMDRHGTTLGLMIREFSGVAPALGQDGNACGAEVLSVLALDATVDQTAPGASIKLISQPDGGNAGTPSSVANAIWQALTVWKESHQGKKLIINLSIGWEPEFERERVNTDGPVFAALQQAASDGALIIAAAGNRSSFAKEYSGLMYPAAYAGQKWDCGLVTPCPLLIPVSGVDQNDNPIVVARQFGITPLLAPALAALGNPQFLAPAAPADAKFTSMTGTSVSAALVTAAAARVWSLNPDATAQTVMQRIWATARPAKTDSALSPITAERLIPHICHDGLAYFPSCSGSDEGVMPKIVSFCHAEDDNKTSNDPCYATIEKRSNFFANTPSATNGTSIKVEKLVSLDPTQISAECGQDMHYYYPAGTTPNGGDPKSVCPHMVWTSKKYKSSVSTQVVEPQPTGCGCDDCLVIHQNGHLYDVRLYVSSECFNLVDPHITLTRQSGGPLSVRLGATLPTGQAVTFEDVELIDYTTYDQAIVTATDESEDERLIMTQLIQ